MDTHTFFQDLAVILVAVGAVAAVFARLGWPKALGYILVGTLLGKYTLGGSFVIDPETVGVLGQLGVVFLMFALGLEFNIRKLRRVGHVIFPTALLDMAVMLWAGHFIGTKILGWNSLQSLFLGAAISDSATTLLAKTITEMGWGSRRFTKYIFGVTITEDILCIGVIALLTGLARSGTLDTGAMAASMGGLLLFLTAVTVFGLLLVPRVLNRVARLKDDEALLLTILGFCFLVAFIAHRLDFSLALGAFLIGVVAAEAEPLKRIYEQCLPLRTLFSAIFFVTIGLLIDPWLVLFHWKAVLGLTVVVVIGKSINCTAGSLLTGLDLKNAIQTGIGLAQIGEFAYLVALIGVTTGVADKGLYQIAVGVSVLTAVLNPFLLRASDPFSDWVMRRLPTRVSAGLETYGGWADRLAHMRTTGETARALRINLALLALQYALVAIFFVAAGLLTGIDYTRLSPVVEANKAPLLWVAACLLALPSGVILFFRARALGWAVADALTRAKAGRVRWTQPLRHGFGLLFIAGAVAGLFVEIALLSGSIMPQQGWARVLVGLTLLAVGAFGWRRFRRLGSESLQTLRNVLAHEAQSNAVEQDSALSGTHTGRVTVGRAAAACGRSLREIDLRARSGASVISIERDGVLHVNPAADERLEADDVLHLLGDDAQLARARETLG